MSRKKDEKTQFRRAEMVRHLRLWDDPRWKKAAQLDLEELAGDAEGLDRLSAAIKAVLRSRQA